MARTCTVRMLGGFEVALDGRPMPAQAWRHRRGADLVKLLALAAGHRLHREQAMAALWPWLGADAAAANVRKAVHFARRALGDPVSIEAGHELLRLWPEGDLHVDVEDFEAAANTAIGSGTGKEAAAQRYTGELLPADRYADWTEPRREQLRLLCLELWRSAGRWEQVLGIDRSDEEAHRALMARHLEAGNRQAAIRQFQRLREVLRVDLGIGPDEETVALFEQALSTPGPASLAERTQALLARGLVAWNRRELAEAERFAEEVRELAREHELAKELGEASALLGLVAFAQGRWLQRFRAEFQDALGLPPAQSAFVLDAHLCLTEAMLGGADCASVADLARQLLPQARDAGSLYGEALASLLVGETELLAGRIGESEASLWRALDLFQRAGSGSGEVMARVSLAEVAARRGRRPAATELLARARPLAEASELAPHLVVRVFAGLVSTAEDDEARLLALDEAERSLRPPEACGPCSIGLRINGTMACARAGEVARARRCLAEADALAGMWQGGPWRAAAWEARAAVRLAEGDREQAAALLREAAGLFAECGRAVDQARCWREAEVAKAGGPGPSEDR
jgi:DNA-binding SARP family transcriptional activator